MTPNDPQINNSETSLLLIKVLAKVLSPSSCANGGGRGTYPRLQAALHATVTAPGGMSLPTSSRRPEHASSLTTRLLQEPLDRVARVPGFPDGSDRPGTREPGFPGHFRKRWLLTKFARKPGFPGCPGSPVCPGFRAALVGPGTRVSGQIWSKVTRKPGFPGTRVPGGNPGSRKSGSTQ